ncbi:unnamed protein product [Absidia cylindrospora]
MSLQHRRGTKGPGDTSKLKSTTTGTKKQDQSNTGTTMTRQKSRQRTPSTTSTAKESKQQQPLTTSRRSSIKPVKKEKDQSSLPQQVDDLPGKDTNTNDIKSIENVSPSSTLLSPVTTTAAATPPIIPPPSPVTSSNDSNTSSPPMVPSLPAIHEPQDISKPVRSRQQQHKLLRPTSCTSLRQVALHQALYPPSPKAKHFNTVYDPSSHDRQQYQQYLIRRSSTFHHQTPPPCSSYRRFSESTLEDSPTTPDGDDDEDDDDMDDDQRNMGYLMDGGYCYDDDDQTLFSNSLLSLDTKSTCFASPPPPQQHHHRQRLKRPISMICQRPPPPDSFYNTDPSSMVSLPQQPSHYHHHHHHAGVVTMDGAGDLCVPLSPGNNYHHQDSYSNNGDNGNSAPSMTPFSPDATGLNTAATAARIGHQHQQQQQRHHTNRSLYLFSDSDSFNKKHPKRHSLQQTSQQQQQQHQHQQQQETSSKRHHLSMDLLKQELESERAVVHALQRQKEAYNKDITYLCQNVDHLTKDGNEWKAKYKQEKAEKEKSRDDLSAALDNFNEATEQIKQLSNEKQRLKEELDRVNRQLDIEKRTATSASPPPPAIDTASFLGQLYGNGTPSSTQDQDQQIKLIQSTMEKLLRLDIFRCTSLEATKKRDDEKPHSVKTMTRATSISGQRKSPSSTRSKSSSSRHHPTATIASATTEKSDPSRFLETDPTISVTDLDDQLQSLLQEKELLQAEYSKIPVSGSNAICRRRREDLEARLDEVDSKMRKIRLKIRRRQNKGGV